MWSAERGTGGRNLAELEAFGRCCGRSKVLPSHTVRGTCGVTIPPDLTTARRHQRMGLFRPRSLSAFHTILAWPIQGWQERYVVTATQQLCNALGPFCAAAGGYALCSTILYLGDRCPTTELWSVRSLPIRPIQAPAICMSAWARQQDFGHLEFSPL